MLEHRPKRPAPADVIGDILKGDEPPKGKPIAPGVVSLRMGAK